ncbi:MAG: hypothetical protein ACRD8W_29855, partial [Nitrososphaeraceae archaeon]
LYRVGICVMQAKFETVTVERTGLSVTCPRCQHSWIYFGERPFSNCSKCRTSVTFGKWNENKNGLVRRFIKVTSQEEPTTSTQSQLRATNTRSMKSSPRMDGKSLA